MLVFDLDDTLYPERDFALSGFRHLDQWIEATKGVRGFGDACWEQFNSGSRRKIFDRVCAELGLPAPPEFITELVERYRGHKPDINLPLDVARFLDSADRPMGLITDGPEHMQRNKIEALQLGRYFDHIRTTGSWPEGFGKPHPRAFVEMEQAAKQDSRMVYVADNPAKDFVTPNSRGWLTLQVIRPGGVHDPRPSGPEYAAHAEIDSFDRLGEVLDELLSRAPDPKRGK